MLYDVESRSLTIYLKEIDKIPRITPEEEIRLSKRIRKGCKKSREKMITSNLKLVVKIAWEYKDLGVPLLDLINEGNKGLMVAVNRFRPNKGAKLSTYASWWIRQSVRRALSDQKSVIRVPVNTRQMLIKYHNEVQKFKDTNERLPTDMEIAKIVSLSPETICNLKLISTSVVSIDSNVNGPESDTIADFVPDTRAVSPSEQIEQEDSWRIVRELLTALSDRERVILDQRFGISGGERKTLDEIGAMFGLTRERIRQIQGKALKTLYRRWHVMNGVFQSCAARV